MKLEGRKPIIQPLYAGALLLAALLLFWIQPLYTKMVLPIFGGAPAVWTTASMFFQFALLAGYLYAHVLSRTLSLRRQALVHIALLLLVVLALPVHVDPAAAAGAAGHPVPALLRLLVVGLGLPFFAVAATAPLLQQWFSRTGHAGSADPYYLYVASNVGSIAALLGYPLLIEPLAALAEQAWAWAVGYVVLGVLIIACAALAWRHGVSRSTESVAASPVAWQERGMWIVLAFAPSSLMLGVTQHISAEIAAVPLLWIVPLALYILTFINAFARRPLIPLAWTVKLQPWLVILLALVWILNIYFSVFILHLLSFVVTALMCHGELARRRPGAAHLTDFYLCIAVGGALGGAFNALAAPLLFNAILEYPVAIALACMLRPVQPASSRLALAGAGVFIAALIALVYLGIHPLRLGAVAIVAYLQVVGVTLYLLHRRPVPFGLAITAVLLTMPLLHQTDEVLARFRNFFGMHTVLKDRSGEFHVLLHGITLHGAQWLDPKLRLEPTAYFHRDGPLGQLFSALGAGGRFKRVALVGLGTGSASCYREPGREWTFFEIDPVVVRVARDRRWFSFVEDCAPGAPVILGDGRLSLAAVPDGRFDLIIIDTFSSDAIPLHMITREAVQLYFRKLAPRGVLMVHVSNEYLDLAPVVARIAADVGVAAMVPGPRISLGMAPRYAEMESRWIALARAPGELAALVNQEGWEPPVVRQKARPWTDDYSNILQAWK